MNSCLIVILMCFIFPAFSQYAPSVGEIGTSAISKDSSVFQFWANSAEISRGWQNISDKNSGLSTLGVISDAIGQPDGRVISLGDSGQITLSFPHRIQNGVSYDFAVFENSFNNTFLELAFVEVSSDGIHFVRFPSVSLTPSLIQLGNDAVMEASNLENLAGKYRGGFGTPFDLEVLKDSPGLDIQNIKFIRLIDVVGSINPRYGALDSKGNLINDPFPTPYPSSGFDLDAVGVINSEFASIPEKYLDFKVWPNPVVDFLFIETLFNENVSILNSIGETMITTQSMGLTKIDVSSFDKGIYIVKRNNSLHKICIQ